MANYDELVQIRQQAAHTRLVEGLQNQRQANLHDYRQAFAENNIDAMAWAEAEYNRNTRELMELTGQAPQQQAQPQQQFTAMEREWMARNPAIMSDPKRRAEVWGAANNLIARGVDRNSAEYIHAIEVACGNVGASGGTTLEGELTPDGVCEICKIDPDTYNRGVEKLHELKLVGHYKDGKP